MSVRCGVCGKQRATEAEHNRSEAEPYAKDHPVRCWEDSDEDCWEFESGGDSIMILICRFRERFEEAERHRDAAIQFGYERSRRRIDDEMAITAMADETGIPESVVRAAVMDEEPTP